MKLHKLIDEEYQNYTTINDNREYELIVIFPNQVENCEMQIFYLINNFNKYYAEWQGDILIMTDYEGSLFTSLAKDNIDIKSNKFNSIKDVLNSSIYIFIVDKKIDHIHMDLMRSTEYDQLVHTYFTTINN